MLNIKEIAKLSNVSPSTVSRVLNNHPYVKEETKKKVLKVIEQFDYVPNLNAVKLKRGRNFLIGIITPEINEILLPYINSFISIANEYGYKTITYSTQNEKDGELDALEALRRKEIDAIVITIRRTKWSEIEPYSKYGPIIALERVDSDFVPSVYLDQYIGYCMALEYLIQKGYRKISNAFGRMEGLNTFRRIQAYRDVLTKYNLPIIEEYNFTNIYSSTDGEKIVQRILKLDDPPSAIICSNDYVAAGIASEAKRKGLEVPRDLAIIGFDNHLMAKILDITTIHNPIKEQAENAFKLIYKKLENTSLATVPLEFQLIKRKTT
ncbi:LacI family DNA-binding transcriptional regulator [Gottfriedia luciferensis]|uniref:LacI family DNA-binding transcriptional regulator n=1 Tax=Gottfriedia luciferensis TaxID=178774 RepID=UPI000B44F64E|nr:LacI family DNA-binding transcriptional regulator [Gottfriedia luciferensis]